MLISNVRFSHDKMPQDAFIWVIVSIQNTLNDK